MKFTIETQAQLIALRKFLNKSSDGTVLIKEPTDNCFYLSINDGEYNWDDLFISKHMPEYDDEMKVSRQVISIMHQFPTDNIVGVTFEVADILALFPPERAYYIDLALSEL